MAVVEFEVSGDFKNLEKFLSKNPNTEGKRILESLGARGVSALSAATPKRTGTTASSWGYVVEQSGSGVTITWTNSNIQNGTPIAIILQYGHGTGTGGYVQGQDYINPAMRPVFDDISSQLAKLVK